METHWLDNRTYVGGTAAVLQNIDPSVKTANGMTLAAPSSLTEHGFVLIVTSKSLNTFSITRTETGANTGRFTRVCSRPNTKGACSTRLTW